MGNFNAFYTSALKAFACASNRLLPSMDRYFRLMYTHIPASRSIFFSFLFQEVGVRLLDLMFHVVRSLTFALVRRNVHTLFILVL